jgi:YD repeat-containing protein
MIQTPTNNTRLFGQRAIVDTLSSQWDIADCKEDNYDANNNLIQITDALGNEFKFGYDSLGRKVSMSDPDMGNWTYVYDQNGNLLFQSGGGGNLVTGDNYYREYNGEGQLMPEART